MFWGDTILCAIYLINKSPSHALGKKTAYEMWHGHIPSVRHFRGFGSIYYALIPKEQRDKLVPGVGSVSSWGTQIPPRRFIFMMT